jgi:DNA-binding NarL/FixJ family response regulator
MLEHLRNATPEAIEHLHDLTTQLAAALHALGSVPLPPVAVPPPLPPTIAAMLKKAKRQMQYMRLACDPKQYTNVQIAELMKLPVGTMHKYRIRLWKRLGFKNHTEMLLFAVRHGLV